MIKKKILKKQSIPYYSDLNGVLTNKGSNKLYDITNDGINI